MRGKHTAHSQYTDPKLYRHILLATLSPLLILAATLTIYLIWEQHKDEGKALRNYGNAITKLVSASAHQAILNKDYRQLQQLSIAPAELENVSDILYLDNQFKILHRTASFEVKIKPNLTSVYSDNDHYYFVNKVVSQQTNNAIFFNSDINITANQVIGWVAVLIKKNVYHDHSDEVMLSALCMLLIFFSITFYFSNTLMKQFFNPLAEITTVVDALQKGHFDKRVTKATHSKLQPLAVGVNKMALKMQESQTDMQTRVDNATRRLQSTLYHLEEQNNALKATKAQEIEANQAKDQFLARMSHELRTPLTSVLGFSKILQETQITPEQVEPIRIINHTSQLLLALIDNILDYSKLQEAAINLEKIDFNIETAVLDILEMQAPMAHSKHLELSLMSFNEFNYDIKGDPTRFKQVITNLISNAIKFTDSGSVALTLEIKKLSSHQYIVILSITDTGIGITEQQLAGLFQAFSQADTSITRRFGGTGLGLVIAKALAQLMGGKLEVYSQVNKGTSVTLKIPTWINAQPRTYTEANKTADKTLIYDENPHTRRAMALILERNKSNYLSITSQAELAKNISLYQHLIIGISAADYQNNLLNFLLPLLSDNNKTVTIAVPSSHPLPQLPSCVNVINKPIRPQILLNHTKILQTPQLSHATPLQQAALKVVIAEDNHFNQLLIEKILHKHNIKTFIANNGQEAIALVEKHNPDLAILDIHMPVMDGFEATELLRQRSDIPIISLTANIIEQDHHKVTLAGSNSVILKPINDIELISTIARLTQKRIAARQLIDQTTSEITSTTTASPTDDTSITSHTTNIEDYGLDLDVLTNELTRLCNLLDVFYQQLSYIEMRDLAHQLVGLAGLYELPEVEITALDLQQALHSENAKRTWLYLYRLRRIVVNSQIEAE